MARFDTRVTFDITETLEDRIEEQLGYGDSKAAFVREAIRQKLERERGFDDGENTE